MRVFVVRDWERRFFDFRAMEVICRSDQKTCIMYNRYRHKNRFDSLRPLSPWCSIAIAWLPLVGAPRRRYNAILYSYVAFPRLSKKYDG